MMVVLRAFALVVIGIGAGALHHVLGPEISLGIGSNAPRNGEDAPSNGQASVDPDPADVQAAPGDAGQDEPGDAGQAEQTPPAETPLTYDDLSEEVDIRGARLIYEMMEAGNAAIIDARRPDEYAAGHILGAVSITPLQFQTGRA